MPDAASSSLNVLAGTSGFSYREWKGSFYPGDLPARAMLEYYASRLPAVEINNTFYRQPTEKLLEGWRAQVPDTFRFAVKAPRRITHLKRMRDCAEETSFLLARLTVLGPSLGSILFQLPPHLRCDTSLLADFVDQLPSGTRAAFEFRHASWFDEAVFGVLRDANLALAVADVDDAPAPDLPVTADWAYLRLRRASYSDAELRAWRERLVEAGVREAQVFFKHEDEAAGPKMAQRFLELGS